MGFFSGAIYSEVLGMDTSIGAIIPHDSRYHRGVCDPVEGVTVREKPRTLILLHGLSDNWAVWGYRTRILSYAEAYDIAVIMPEVQRSFYQDMRNGEAYFTYITEELPKLVAGLFNISTEPGDLMIAGLSMGGYGALRCGLANPGRYRAIGAFSSAPDLEGFVFNMPDRKETSGYRPTMRGIFGEVMKLDENADLYRLCDRAAEAGAKLPFMMTCGTEDELYQDNENFYNYMVEKGMNVTFDKWPGIHEWGFWDVSIQMFLERYAR